MAGSSGIKRELPILITVLGTAIALGAAVAILPGLGRESAEEAQGAAQYRRAVALEKEDAEKALDVYASIPPAAGDWHTRAQAQVARLQKAFDNRAPQPTAEEQRDFDALREFWRQNPSDHDGLIQRGEAFVAAHPRGELRADVERRIADARRIRDESRGKEAEDVELTVKRQLDRRDFAGAILTIEKAGDRLRGDLDLWPKLAARRDTVVAEALRYYRKQMDEADRLVKEGMKDDARRLWYSTIKAFGDGKVPELADLCKAAALRSEEIRP